jgi:hypothetical protein
VLTQHGLDCAVSASICLVWQKAGGPQIGGTLTFVQKMHPYDGHLVLVLLLTVVQKMTLYE